MGQLYRTDLKDRRVRVLAIIYELIQKDPVVFPFHVELFTLGIHTMCRKDRSRIATHEN